MHIREAAIRVYYIREEPLKYIISELSLQNLFKRTLKVSQHFPAYVEMCILGKVHSLTFTITQLYNYSQQNSSKNFLLKILWY